LSLWLNRVKESERPCSLLRATLQTLNPEKIPPSKAF
jgi:hypothetical protein